MSDTTQQGHPPSDTPPDTYGESDALKGPFTLDNGYVVNGSFINDKAVSQYDIATAFRAILDGHGMPSFFSRAEMMDFKNRHFTKEDIKAFLEENDPERYGTYPAHDFQYGTVDLDGDAEKIFQVVDTLTVPPPERRSFDADDPLGPLAGLPEEDDLLRLTDPGHKHAPDSVIITTAGSGVIIDPKADRPPGKLIIDYEGSLSQADVMEAIALIDRDTQIKTPEDMAKALVRDFSHEEALEFAALIDDPTTGLTRAHIKTFLDKQDPEGHGHDKKADLLFNGIQHLHDHPELNPEPCAATHTSTGIGILSTVNADENFFDPLHQQDYLTQSDIVRVASELSQLEEGINAQGERPQKFEEGFAKRWDIYQQGFSPAEMELLTGLIDQGLTEDNLKTLLATKADSIANESRNTGFDPYRSMRGYEADIAKAMFTDLQYKHDHPIFDPEVVGPGIDAQTTDAPLPTPAQEGCSIKR